ncbi:hypothetical protein [uncultured Tateyamaria sp.]|uniref:hypothetical protein n=1 Tax=uncultured Tateyamaria sp. TaxID=455651 RepID=UPI00262E82CC|nr:hypothetical protein [uncultured Tateyamaria sp.]
MTVDGNTYLTVVGLDGDAVVSLRIDSDSARADVFVFSGAIGNNTIKGFVRGSDVIDFSAIANISFFVDFQAAALSLNGSSLIKVDGATTP